MAVKTKAQLKAYFQTGLKPTQAQFEDLIDSTYIDVANSYGNDDELNVVRGYNAVQQMYEPLMIATETHGITNVDSALTTYFGQKLSSTFGLTRVCFNAFFDNANSVDFLTYDKNNILTLTAHTSKYHTINIGNSNSTINIGGQAAGSSNKSNVFVNGKNIGTYNAYVGNIVRKSALSSVIMPGISIDAASDGLFDYEIGVRMLELSNTFKQGDATFIVISKITSSNCDITEAFPIDTNATVLYEQSMYGVVPPVGSCVIVKIQMIETNIIVVSQQIFA